MQDIENEIFKRRKDLGYMNTIPPRAICIIKCNSSAITSAWFFNWWTLIAITRGCCYSWWVMSKSLSHTASHGSGGGLEFLETQTPNHHQQYLTKKKKKSHKRSPPYSQFYLNLGKSAIILYSFPYKTYLPKVFMYFLPYNERYVVVEFS